MNIWNKIEFEECLDLFHYIYKGFNIDKFTENEFLEFYYFISFLIESDNNFISLLNNEWKSIIKIILILLLETIIKTIN